MISPEVVAPVLPNNIATNLRLLRKRAGWSQAELAERVGMNRGNIASYESGSAEPNICKLLRFSNLFSITPRDITRRDLSQPEELALAEAAHQAARSAEHARLSQFRQRALELEELLHSSRRLYDYKRGKIEVTNPEAEVFAAQYLQLFEVADQLMREHRELLNEVGCQCD